MYDVRKCSLFSFSFLSSLGFLGDCPVRDGKPCCAQEIIIMRGNIIVESSISADTTLVVSMKMFSHIYATCKSDDWS